MVLFGVNFLGKIKRGLEAIKFVCLWEIGFCLSCLYTSMERNWEATGSVEEEGKGYSLRFPRSTACSSAAEKVSPSAKPPGMPDWSNQPAGAVQGDSFLGCPSPPPAPFWCQYSCFDPAASSQSALPRELVVVAKAVEKARMWYRCAPSRVGQWVNKPEKIKNVGELKQLSDQQREFLGLLLVRAKWGYRK